MKKKIIAALSAAALMVTVQGCQAADPVPNISGTTVSQVSTTAESTSDPAQADESNDSRVLIAYFTWAENTEVANPEAVDVDATSSASLLSPGHVGQLAAWIEERTGGERFSIQVEESYPSDFDTCLERVRQEQESDARPQLKTHVADMDAYDVIYLGYPDWGSTSPMAIMTFLEEYDFTGKTVIPFCAHGTSGLGTSVEDITQKLPGATVLDAFGVQRPGMDTPLEEAKASLDAWLDQRSTGSSNILIAYFGLNENDEAAADVDTSTSASVVVSDAGREGTTEAVATMIQRVAGGDKHSIQTVQLYADDFDAVVDQNHAQQRESVRPELKSQVADMDQYDIVFIGYPVWASTIPAPIMSFLEQNDMAGKTIIPFCTHDGYGAGRSVTAIRELCPQSQVLDGFAVAAEQVGGAQTEVGQWLQTLDVTGMAEASEVSGTAEADQQSQVQTEYPVRITIGNTVIDGVLNNSPEAHQFMAMLPQTITMGEFGGREYYGGISGSIAVESQGKYNFEDGEITYCPANNTAAIFYSQSDRPNLTMEIFSMGKVVSDLAVFDQLDSRVDITFELVQ